jgi:hypothetical protein
MYLSSLEWSAQLAADVTPAKPYEELSKLLAVDETDLRDTFIVTSREAQLSLFGGAQLVQYDVQSGRLSPSEDSATSTR